MLILQATAEANNLAAVAGAKELYSQSMEGVCGGTKPYLNSAHLESEHLRFRDKAVEFFRSKRKMGGEEFSEMYRQRLEEVSLNCLCENTHIEGASFAKALHFLISKITLIIFGHYIISTFREILML